MDEYGGHWITTYTGKKFHFLEPKQEEIDIKDIAHALSLTCRFGGQCKEFYSVAEHSIRVAEIVPEKYKLLALLHDASEAYMPDLPRPIKATMLEFRELELDILVAIWRKFVPETSWTLTSVKYADSVLLATEARDLMDNMKDWAKLPEPLKGKVHPYTSSSFAEEYFLAKFKEYGGE